MRTLPLFVALLAASTCAALADNSYQATQRDKAYEAWRQRAFFDNNTASSSSSSPSNFNGTHAQKDYSSDIAFYQQQARVEAEYRREVAAWEAKLARQAAQAKAQREEAYRKFRDQLGGRLPLHEPPIFNSDSERREWYRDQAEQATAEDSFVLWFAAYYEVNTSHADTDIARARRYIERADRTWPEVRALLGRMRLLGEGGPADVKSGWELLKDAEAAYASQGPATSGRYDVYYAEGRAFAEGIGVPVDPIKALVAFDQNGEKQNFHRQTYSYLIDTFWPAHAQHASDLLDEALALGRSWNLSPLSSLSAAAERPRNDSQLEAERKKNGFVSAQLNDFGQPELIRQLLINYHSSDRRDSPEGREMVLSGIDKELARGVTRVAVERLLPDRYGKFLEMEAPAQREKWIAEGRETLDELAAQNDGRALAAKVHLALSEKKDAEHFQEAIRSAEQALEVGEPWAAVMFAAETSRSENGDEALRDKGLALLARVRTLPKAERQAYWIAEYLSNVLESQLGLPVPFWELGVKRGDFLSGSALTRYLLARLGRNMQTLDADEKIWLQIEPVLIETQSANTNPDHAKLIAAELSDMSARHAGYRDDVLSRSSPEYAMQKFRARVATEGPKAAEKLKNQWADLSAKLADPKQRWSWETPHSVSAQDEFGLDETERRYRYLVAASENMEGVLRGEILLSPTALEQAERGLGDAEAREYRTTLVNAFEQLAKTRGEAAIAFGRYLGPSHEQPRFLRTREAQQHAAHWLRHAIELGSTSAVKDLVYYFEGEPELVELYKPAEEIYDQASVDTPAPAASILAALPSPELEAAALDRASEQLDARRKAVAHLREQPASRTEQNIQAAIAELKRAITKENPASTPVRAVPVAARQTSAGTREVFFQSFEQPDSDQEELDLSEMANDTNVARLLVARFMGVAATGKFYGVEHALRYTSGAERDEIVAAANAVLRRDAERGSLGAVKELVALQAPGSLGYDLPGWPKSEVEAVKWARQALLMGDADYLDLPASIYAGREGSAIMDTQREARWNEFVAAYRAKFTDDPKPEEIAAFAQERLPAD